MNLDEFLVRRIAVCGGALIYWGGVFVQGRRIRKRIGRSPNLQPRTPRERLLWAGWILVAVAWIVQPLLVGVRTGPPGMQILPVGMNWPFLFGGLALTVAGYLATLWCYAIMGSTWRIGINREEKNQLIIAGPYRWIRHPIYAFQTVMLVGALLLLPTIVSIVVVLLHLTLVLIKAKDEESYLLAVHGEAYRNYLARTGRIFPKLW